MVAGGAATATIRIGNRPQWAPGAAEAVAAFVAARGGPVRVLEFGSGGATLFLLGLGAQVTSIDHQPERVAAVGEKAAARGLEAGLALFQRDRPYHKVSADLVPAGGFDVLLIQGRDRIGCLHGALPHVRSDGIVLLDDTQRDFHWPAFVTLADKPCTTYVGAAKRTTIWSLAAGETGFVPKRVVDPARGTDPNPPDLMVPREFLDGTPLGADYVVHRPIEGLKPVERDLQALRMIERKAIYIAPRLRTLADSSLRIDAGRKIFSVGGRVFREKIGDCAATDEFPLFEGEVALPGRTLDITSSGAGRYSFFLLDSLPKFALLRTLGLTLADFDTILVNSGAQWVHDMLAWALGGAQKSVRAFNSEAPSFRMERSVHIDGVRTSRFTPRWVHAYLESIFPKAPGEGDAESFGPFVYISRQKATGRQVINNDDLMGLLRTFGFREVFAEDYPPSQLARLLGQARVVLSPHGAGLANIIFCPKTTTVVELFSSHFTPQYFYLARDIGQEYVAVPCVDAHGLNVFDRYTADTPGKATYNREDIVAPLVKLKALLTTLCR